VIVPSSVRMVTLSFRLSGVGSAAEVASGIRRCHQDGATFPGHPVTGVTVHTASCENTKRNIMHNRTPFLAIHNLLPPGNTYETNSAKFGPVAMPTTVHTLMPQAWLRVRFPLRRMIREDPTVSRYCQSWVTMALSRQLSWCWAAAGSKSSTHGRRQVENGGIQAASARRGSC
jgi:hypothetical protein